MTTPRDTTACLLVVPPGRVRIDACRVADVAGGDVLIRTEVTSISPGTELRCLRAVADGSATAFVPGYSNVGRVVRVGPGADASLVGRRVFSSGSKSVEPHRRQWGAHVADAVVPARSCVPIDDDADPSAVALSKLAAIALHGVRLASVEPNDRVVVLGLGIIGQFSARLCKMIGASVRALDRQASRVEAAARAGVPADVLDGGDVSGLLEANGGGDVVIDATGAAAALPVAIGLLRPTPWDAEPVVGPRLVIQGSYPGDITLPYPALFQREARVLVPRDNTFADLRDAAAWLASGELSAKGLITSTIEVADAPALYDRLGSSPDLMTACIRWS